MDTPPYFSFKPTQTPKGLECSSMWKKRITTPGRIKWSNELKPQKRIRNGRTHKKLHGGSLWKFASARLNNFLAKTLRFIKLVSIWGRLQGFLDSNMKLHDIASLKLTQPVKIGLAKRKIVFQASFFRSYVSFRECISADPLEPWGQGEGAWGGSAWPRYESQARIKPWSSSQPRPKLRMRCRGSGASVSQRFEGRVRHTVVLFRRFGRAAEGAV